MLTLTEQDRIYGQWTSIRSWWSFCTKNGPFGHDIKGTDGKRLHVPETFTDAFEHLVTHINFMPSRFPITIVWNKHLPHFDSTREQQVFKSFSSLSSDLPFDYGSLTVCHTSFRSWFGSTSMTVFDVPGLEFFATTVEYQVDASSTT